MEESALIKITKFETKAKVVFPVPFGLTIKNGFLL
jgi:hypothetical protein